MFPREITTTPVWIRHQLPLYAPPPPDGDKKLRQHFRNQLKTITDKELNEVVQKERARLNLKWCFDEYFGSPIPRPTLGQIVTANVFGNVYLGSIVGITRSSIILVSVDTLAVLPAVNHEDIYSSEYSPFFENYLHDERVYHPQHILDLWSSFQNDPQSRHTGSSSSADILSSVSTDITSEWPVGNETWFTHDVLPQRSEFIHCHEEEILCISTKNMTENTEQHPISLATLSSVSIDQSIRPVHSSNPSAVTIDQRYNHSLQVNLQDPVITPGPHLSRSNLCLHKQSHLLSSSVLTPGFVRQPGTSILLSILLICLITALSRPIKPHIESSPLTLAPELVPVSLLMHNFYVQPVTPSLVLHDINNRDWFRTLAVP